jgi:hypothetical protein
LGDFVDITKSCIYLLKLLDSDLLCKALFTHR